MKIIYGLQHDVTKRIYVGNTGNVGRIKKHLEALRNGRHTNEIMQQDFYVYGDHFTAYILEVICDTKKTTKRERYWMHYFNTQNPEYGYNYKDHMSRKRNINEFPTYSDERMREIMGIDFPYVE